MNQSYRIMSIEAKDIYAAAMQGERGYGDGQYNIRDTYGNIKTKNFTNTLDWSLDTMKLIDVYEKRVRRRDFAFRVGRHAYTKHVICVTFKYSYKEFNMAYKNTYVKHGHNPKDCVFEDGVCVVDGELIAIQTGVNVSEAVSEDILGKCFFYEGGKYHYSGGAKTIADKAALREYMYTNGFKCDGVEYVRYKRSSGSSRVGKCLFINKNIAKDMAKWDKCGLNVVDGQDLDLAAWEAYIALPMSSIIDTMVVPLDNILVVDDYNSVFNDDVVAVEIQDGHLVSSKKNVQISNSIWDGQSLMDKSLFGKYADKGMLLLRNRFFKSCCFNTNIQKWFADNGITSVSQLKGFTLAKDISQVRLITTPSSIKYTKFGTIEDWLQNVDPVFGIVKYDKKTPYFDGRLVQAHYQLFNTLQLTYEEMEQVLDPSLRYISAVRRDPAVLRYEIQYPKDEGDGSFASLDSKNEIVFRMLGINDKFANTKLYYDFRDDLIKSMVRNLRRGHVLISGNYSTIMGNGMEMLMESIGAFNGEPTMAPGAIRSTRFEYGKTILASRSPHVTVGNVLLVRNEPSAAYDTYFNTSDEIVCINAIGENVQQRLNGCDYDSDTVLLTDNELLVEVAERSYGNFLVPTNMTSSVKTTRCYTQNDKADLDVKTSVNKIGEIINLSQQLNSLMWDKINKGASIESCTELYHDICKLAVLSNVEIDRAKREFIINSAVEIGLLKKKYKILDGTKSVKPQFFKMITTENGFELSDSVRYKYFRTPMDFLQKIVSRFNFREGRENKRVIQPFMSMIKEPETSWVRQGHYYACREKIIDAIRASREERKRVFEGFDNMSRDEKNNAWRLAGDIKQNCIEEVEKLPNSPGTMYAVLKSLDDPEYRDVARAVFEILFGKPDEAFYRMLINSREKVYTLTEDEAGDLEFYGIKFKKTPLSELENGR